MSSLPPLWLEFVLAVAAMEDLGPVSYLLSGEVVPIDLSCGDGNVSRGREARERLAAFLGVSFRRLRLVNFVCGDHVDSDEEVLSGIQGVVCQVSWLVSACYDFPSYVYDADRNMHDFSVVLAKTSVTVWDVGARVEVFSFSYTNNGMSDPCVYLASSCMRFVTAISRHVHMWSLETLVCECTFTEPKGEVAIVTLSSDGRCLASYWDGYSFCEADTVRVWIVEGGSDLTFVHGLGMVTDMCFSPDGNRLATISCLNIASVWNRATGVCEFRFSPTSLVRVVLSEYSWDRTIRSRNSVFFLLTVIASRLLVPVRECLFGT